MKAELRIKKLGTGLGILILLASGTLAQRPPTTKEPVTIGDDGKIYPLLKNGNPPDLPANSKVGGNPIGGGLSSVSVGKTLFVDTVIGNDLVAERGRLDKPFKTLAAAVNPGTGVTSGDVIKVGPGAFPVSNLIVPTGVTLVGAGQDVTFLDSADVFPAVAVIPSTNSQIRDLTIRLGPTGYNVGIGISGFVPAATPFTGVIVRNVKIIGSSDAIYIAASSTTTLTIYDSVLISKFDTVSLFGGWATVLVYNTDTFSTGPFSVPAEAARGLVSYGGTIKYFGGNITVSGGGAGGNFGAFTGTLGGGSGSVEVTNARLNVSGTGATDLYNEAGTISKNNVVRSDGAKLTTFGTVTDLSRDLSKDAAGTINIAPGLDVISPGLTLANTAAAVSGGQQLSPARVMEGRGWKTNATAASRSVRFRDYVQTIQGAANPSGVFTIESSINNAAYAHPFYFYSTGGFGVGTGGGSVDPQDGGIGVNNVFFTSTVRDTSGAGTPEGVVTAGIGSSYRRTDGSGSTALYVKGSGTGNTGWVAIGTGGGAGLVDGDYGAITVSGTGTVMTLDADPPLLFPNATMPALAVDVAKRNNGPKNISADSTLTFIGAPGTGFTFGLTLVNTDSAAHTITIPSSYSLTTSGTRTSFPIAAGEKMELSWRYDGTTYFLAGDPGKQADVWAISVSNLTDAITTSSFGYMHAPRAATVTGVKAGLLTASSSGTVTFTIKEAGTTILSTNLTVDATENTSATAAVPAVVSDSAIADNALMRADVTGAGTGAIGGIVYIYVQY